MGGYITERALYAGEMASTSAPLLTVMDISQVIAKAHVPQSDALLLHRGDKVNIDVAGLENGNGNGKKISGTLTLVSPALDPNSTTVEIWVQAANPGLQLRPGMTAQLSITAQTVHDALVVPASALLNASGGDAQVMVIDAKSSEAHLREVKTGIQNAQQVQIMSGLNPGEVVVSEGAYGLPDKTKVKVEKANASSKSGGKADSDE